MVFCKYFFLVFKKGPPRAQTIVSATVQQPPSAVPSSAPVPSSTPVVPASGVSRDVTPTAVLADSFYNRQEIDRKLQEIDANINRLYDMINKLITDLPNIIDKSTEEWIQRLQARTSSRPTSRQQVT